MGSHDSCTLSAWLRVVLSSSMVPLISSSCSKVLSMWRCWSTQRAVSFSHSSLATVACFHTKRLMFWIRCLGETSRKRASRKVKTLCYVSRNATVPSKNTDGLSKDRVESRTLEELVRSDQWSSSWTFWIIQRCSETHKHGKEGEPSLPLVITSSWHLVCAAYDSGSCTYFSDI